MIQNVFQIFLTGSKEELPPFLQRTTNSIPKYFRGFNHKIFVNEELRSFIKDNYDNEVLWAYDSLKPFSYKSDLGRFCLLHQYGGWYFDIAIECKKRFIPKHDIDLICFRDEQRHAKNSWAVAGGIIYSKPKNIIMLTAIEDVIRNCKEKWYGRTPLCPTGPGLLGEVIAKRNRGQEIVFGELVRPMIPFTRKNFPLLKRLIKTRFILPNNETIGIVKPARGGDLKSLGVNSSNNYNTFWHEKNVYN